MLNIIKQVINFFWAITKRRLKVVVDTCILLNEHDRKKLQYLRGVLVPKAVLEQIIRMASDAQDADTEEEIKVNKNKAHELAMAVESIMLDNISTGKWQIISSSGSGLLQSIENKKLAEFDLDLINHLKTIFSKKKNDWNQKRSKLNLEPIEFNPDKLILRDLLGSTDLRIIACCLKLKNKKMPYRLVTRDRVLLLIAEALDLNAVSRVEHI